MFSKKLVLLMLVGTISVILASPIISHAHSDIPQPPQPIEMAQNTDVQQNTTTNLSSEDLITVEVQLGTQSPWDNSVPVTIRFKTELDSGNAQISWDLPNGMRVKENYQDFMPVNKGQVYTVSATLYPNEAGRFDIPVSITIWRFNTNYTNSARTTLTFDNNLVLQPMSSEYQMGVMFKYIGILVLIVVLLVLIVIVAKFGLKKLQVWLQPPD